MWQYGIFFMLTSIFCQSRKLDYLTLLNNAAVRALTWWHVHIICVYIYKTHVTVIKVWTHSAGRKYKSQFHLSNIVLTHLEIWSRLPKLAWKCSSIDYNHAKFERLYLNIYIYIDSNPKKKPVEKILPIWKCHLFFPERRAGAIKVTAG